MTRNAYRIRGWNQNSKRRTLDPVLLLPSLSLYGINGHYAVYKVPHVCIVSPNILLPAPKACSSVSSDLGLVPVHAHDK